MIGRTARIVGPNSSWAGTNVGCLPARIGVVRLDRFMSGSASAMMLLLQKQVTYLAC
jgi:hypothetical protein